MSKIKTPVEANPVADCLRAARRRIRNRRKWFQNTKNWKRGTHCAWTAMKGPQTDRAASLFRDVIGIRDILVWNDNPKRTHAQVLAAFDNAIELAEEKP